MKPIYILFFLLISACKDEKAKPASENTTTKTETKKVTYAKNIDFDCYDFFSKGDYSSVCFIDTKLPEHINRGCIFDFVTKGDKHKQRIQF